MATEDLYEDEEEGNFQFYRRLTQLITAIEPLVIQFFFQFYRRLTGNIITAITQPGIAFQFYRRLTSNDKPIPIMVNIALSILQEINTVDRKNRR